MTDEKVAGVGPYTFYERADGRFMIEGPGIFTDVSSERMARKAVHRLNIVFELGWQRGFAAGLKAERKRCLEIAIGYSDCEGIAQNIAKEIG